MSDHLGGHRYRSSLTGEVSEVTVRRRVVDATYVASRVPATDPPPFEVAAGVRCIPVGELVGVHEPPDGYVVIGGGKTALDAICWLLDRDVPDDDITWIRPRDSWLLSRHVYQPLDSVVRTFEAVVLQLEAVASSETVEEIFERLEADGIAYRTDPTVTPTTARGATVSLAELEQLRRVEDVVRLGYVQRIEPDRIVLDDGSIPSTASRLHIHCAAPGLAVEPPVPIFTDDGITLQCISRGSLTMSAALTGYVETTDRTTGEKARLCPPNALTNTPFDWMRWILFGMRTEMQWQDAGDVQAWLDGSRLNLMKGLSGRDPVVRDLQGRFVTSLFPAIERIEQLATAATPGERALLFDPAGH
jgi:hypothetical protein